MFAAMMKASLGDDVYNEDDSVKKLERYVATLCGHEGALFCASGTMVRGLSLLFFTPLILITPPSSFPPPHLLQGDSCATPACMVHEALAWALSFMQKKKKVNGQRARENASPS